MASAMITFDNADGWLPIEFSEVTIARRAYRDGTNEYLMNDQKVRLRDVNELLSRTGLSQRTYTIIGQGLVDAALSLRADERRRLFEEAAGIGLYRSRREESLRRLETTKRNLERVQDILAELRPRLRSLERQMRRSVDYEQVKTDLNEVLRTWYGYHWYQLMAEVTRVNQHVHQETITRDDLRQQQTEVEKTLADSRARIASLRSQLHVWSEQITGLYGEREQAGKTLAVSEERLRWVNEQQALFEAEIELTISERDILLNEIQSVQAEFGSEQARYEEIKTRQDQLLQSGELSSEQIGELKRRVDAARKELEQVTSRQITWQVEKDHLIKKRDEVQARRAQIHARHAEQVETLDGKADDIKLAAVQVQRAESDLALAQEEISRAEGEHREQEDRLQALTLRSAKLEVQITSAQARLEVLSASDGRDGDIPRRLLEASDKGHLKGLAGSLFDHLEIPPDLRMAIRAALGEFNSGLAFDSWEDLLQALEYSDGSGRAALLPLEPVRRIPLAEVPDDRGCLGNAADMVRAEERYQDVLATLLGRTLITRDRAAAQRLVDKIPPDVRLVTLQGDIYFPGGQVIIGQVPDEAQRLEWIAEATAQKKAVSEQLSALETEIQALTSSMQDARAAHAQAIAKEGTSRETLRSARLESDRLQLELATLRKEQEIIEGELQALEHQEVDVQSGLEKHEVAGRDLILEHEKVLGALEEAQGAYEQAEPSIEMARVEARLEVARGSITDAERRLESMRQRLIQFDREIADKKSRLEGSREEKGELMHQIEIAQSRTSSVEDRLSQLLEQARPAEEELAEAERKRSGIEEEVSQLRVKLQNVERTYAQAQIDLARKREEQTSLRRRIEDDFGLVAFEYDDSTVGQEPLPFEGLVEKLPRVPEVPEGTETQMNRLRLQLRRMGPVNPEARREFAEVKKRSEFLTAQVDDLRKAESQIHEVIAELDLLMEREFRKTFEAVAVEFKSAFARLFGGGSARLTLTDPEDLTNSGIDIEARLPGRRTQSLAMLSGGERSLTASALIFSLLKVSPTPFCVLDEVDAMLDEANITRFSEMLSELSGDTQFILITHNRLTVQAAEIVYGISMGSDSASKVISLKLDEFKKEAVR
jgi:chromosome segregation protein